MTKKASVESCKRNIIFLSLGCKVLRTVKLTAFGVAIFGMGALTPMSALASAPPPTSTPRVATTVAPTRAQIVEDEAEEVEEYAIGERPFIAEVPGDELGIDRSYRNATPWHEMLFWRDADTGMDSTIMRIFHMADTERPIQFSRQMGGEMSWNQGIQSIYITQNRSGNIGIIFPSREMGQQPVLLNSHFRGTVPWLITHAGDGFTAPTGDLTMVEVVDRIPEDLLKYIPQEFWDGFEEAREDHDAVNSRHESILIPQDFAPELDMDAQIEEITGMPAQEARKMVADMQEYIRIEVQKVFKDKEFPHVGGAILNGQIYVNIMGPIVQIMSNPSEVQHLLEEWRAFLVEMNLGWGHEQQIADRENPREIVWNTPITPTVQAQQTPTRQAPAQPNPQIAAERARIIAEMERLIDLQNEVSARPWTPESTAEANRIGEEVIALSARLRALTAQMNAA
ncbi:MAG: hypothetical protein FWD90_08540 [Defluviitaleaceae bacterium]|nr:hypothetical protein [Defluviitaleaceae bacterium]